MGVRVSFIEGNKTTRLKLLCQVIKVQKFVWIILSCPIHFNKDMSYVVMVLSLFHSCSCNALIFLVKS